ncbi:hypothetical protein [Prescottella subtropica]|uniref:hypothetical protein n=1 Tax=Prescottella subtropica TaxID=2545757 RepID=UPI0010F8386F|nr:hypothetical protein [Prescottella subtropica]
MDVDSVTGGLSARLRPRWRLFADWCAGVEEPALPTSREVLTRFLLANPASSSTQRERLAAIRAAHAVAAASLPAHTRPTAVVAGTPPPRWAGSRAAAVVASLPTAGCPAGIFGRRDALLLVLTQAAGLSYERIERLQRDQVWVVDRTLHVQNGPVSVTVPAETDPRWCPVAVYLRWARLRAYADRFPTTERVRAAIARSEPMTADTVESYAPLPPPRWPGPLVLPIDRWGGFGADRLQPAGQEAWGLRAAAIGDIIAAHLAGAGPRHVSVVRERPTPPVVEEPVDSPPEPPPWREWDVEAGLRARAEAQQVLADVADTMRDVEAEADALMARLESILDTENSR